MDLLCYDVLRCDAMRCHAIRQFLLLFFFYPCRSSLYFPPSPPLPSLLLPSPPPLTSLVCRHSSFLSSFWFWFFSFPLRYGGTIFDRLLQSCKGLCSVRRGGGPLPCALLSSESLLSGPLLSWPLLFSRPSLSSLLLSSRLFLCSFLYPHSPSSSPSSLVPSSPSSFPSSPPASYTSQLSSSSLSVFFFLFFFTHPFSLAYKGTILQAVWLFTHLGPTVSYDLGPVTLAL